jgi:hypothetical protein
MGSNLSTHFFPFQGKYPRYEGDGFKPKSTFNEGMGSNQSTNLFPFQGKYPKNEGDGFKPKSTFNEGMGSNQIPQKKSPPKSERDFFNLKYVDYL